MPTQVSIGPRDTQPYEKSLYTPGRSKDQVLADLQGYSDSKAGCATFELYQRLMPALRGNGDPADPLVRRSQILLSNLAEAFDVALNCLRSNDPDVRYAARGRMTQGLLEQTRLRRGDGH